MLEKIINKLNKERILAAKELSLLRKERQEAVADITSSTIIRQFGRSLGKHLSSSMKMERIINATLKEYKQTLPKRLAIQCTREIYKPYKIAMQMDKNFTGFNFGALNSLRKVQTLKKGERGLLPFGETVRKSMKKLEELMSTHGLAINYQSIDDASFDVEVLLRMVLKLYKLDNVALNSSVKIALTGDGAQFTNSVGHVTVGLKIIDPRAIEPFTNELLFTNTGYQSVDVCYPIKSVIAKESELLYREEFGSIYAFFDLLGRNGLPASSRGPKLQPFEVVAPHDGKAVFHILGRGGGAKIIPAFCPYCSITSKELVTSFHEKIFHCSTCLSKNAEYCRHWKFESQENIEQMRNEYTVLRNRGFSHCTSEAFLNDPVVKYLNTAEVHIEDDSNLHSMY